MNGSTLWKGVMWMSAAVVADGFIVLAVASISARLAGKRCLDAPDTKGWAALLGVGLTTGVFLEWLARVLNLWKYGPLMPTLPALCVWLVTRREKGQAG